MANNSLEERLATLYQKRDHIDQFYDADLKTIIDAIRDAREHGGTASVVITPLVGGGGYKITITDSEGIAHNAEVRDGGDAYAVYESTVPQDQTPMSKTDWLASLKGADGADAVNPFKGYYPTGVSKPATGAVGDYLYAPPSDSQSTSTATIWHYDSTQTPPWTDTGIDVSAVVGVEFASGQAVPATKIKNENGDDVDESGVLGAAVGAIVKRNNEAIFSHVVLENEMHGSEEFVTHKVVVRSNNNITASDNYKTIHINYTNDNIVKIRVKGIANNQYYSGVAFLSTDTESSSLSVIGVYGRISDALANGNSVFELTPSEVPEGTKSLMVTGAANQDCYLEFERNYEVKGLNEKVEDLENDVVGIGGIVKENHSFRNDVESLNEGEILSLSIPNCCKRYTICCSMNVSNNWSGRVSISSLSTYNKGHLEIDDSNIYAYDATNNIYKTIAHGLTISQQLTVTLIQDSLSQFAVKVIVSSSTGVYSTSGIYWYSGGTAPVELQMVSGGCSNASLSLALHDCDVWLFGDSYMDYVLRNIGKTLANEVKNLYVDGYPGRTSQGGLVSLRKAVSVASPKVLVWALGMNDADSTTAVNATWLDVYNQVSEICKHNAIELVLVTIPTTPVVNNNFKNEVIASSGYRYVDIASAVGADGTGSWGDGLLSSDNVHPTNKGAKIIFEKYIADLPNVFRQRDSAGAEVPSPTGPEDVCLYNGVVSPSVAVATLGDGEQMDIADYPLGSKSRGESIVFRANVATFDKLLIGKSTKSTGFGSNYSSWLEIDNTSIIIKKKVGSNAVTAAKTEAHGLTIQDTVAVIIATDDNGTTKITVGTVGGTANAIQKTITVGLYSGDGGTTAWQSNNYGRIRVQSVGSTLTNCKLSVANKHLRDPFCVFGASFDSTDDQTCWPYYAKQLGVDNIYINANPGRGIAAAYADLQQALVLGTPKFLLWTMWGNDSAADLDTYIGNVKSLCDEKGIVLIIVDRPNSPASSSLYAARKQVIDNYINAGVRYWNIAAAVSSNPSDANSWYEGYLQGDGQHPTALGSRAMAMQLMADVPELLQF